MRKIKDLNGDEFLDLVFALSPVLPLILDMEIVKSQFLGAINENVRKQATILRKETAKEKGRQKEDVIEAATVALVNEQSMMAVRDITLIVPKLVSKEYRSATFEGLAIIEGKTIDEIRALPAPQLVGLVHQVIKDIDLKDFLPFAEQPEAIG